MLLTNICTAVVWGVENFGLYVYGSQFQIITNPKPLLGIFKSQQPALPRMDRLKLRFMPYNCQLLYRPRKDNPVDFVSRHPNPANKTEDPTELCAYYLCSNAIPKAMTREEVKLETKLDPILQQVATTIFLN